MLTDLTAQLAVRHQGERVDGLLLTLWLGLVSFGLVMIASASIATADTAPINDAWYYVKRHVVWLGISSVAAVIMMTIPMSFWRRYGGWLVLLAFALLVMVLLPGLGRRVNGAQRWLQLGPLGFQASEAVKFCSIIFFASYITRRQEELRQTWAGFLKPVAIVGAMGVLLLMEPDFGSTVVLLATVMTMLFVSGIKVGQFLVVVLAGCAVLWKLATESEYRLQRLVTFLDPWADQFNSGYQLTQSLIAFGRGEWFGLGLGNSVQKLLFLPEAHTDFIFAVIAEELGLIGGLLVLLAMALLIARLLRIARQSVQRNQLFNGLIVFAIAIIFAVQTIINVGVSSGFLPTKGLTLPFISYGGSSLLVCFAFMGLAMRVRWEMPSEAELLAVQPLPKRSYPAMEAAA